jgi:putative flavoprotein involved in K+ transport
MEHLRAVVIGGGQAGLAASHELTVRGVEHVILEAGIVGQTWRTRRWGSFRLVSPNWLNRLPGYWYDGPGPYGFFDTAEMLAYLEGYAASFDAPVRSSTPVTGLKRLGSRYAVATAGGTIEADAVIVATGAFGQGRIPALSSALPAGIRPIHTDDYRAPDDLPPGGVVVVGAGQSGLQIADELVKAGREVVVAVGRHGWVPRLLYGRDQMYWRLENGDLFSVVGNPDQPAADYPFTALSRWGREDFNVRTVWQDGVRLAGHLESIDGGRLHFASDLASLLEAGDEYARTFAQRVRDFARARGEPVPEPELTSAWPAGAIPEPVTSIDIERDHVSSVIWTTGYRHDFSWIRVPGAISHAGVPYQREGASPVSGLFFVGLHRGWHAADGTVLGAGWLAERVAETIAAS